MLKRVVEDMIEKAVKKPMMHSKTSDRIFNHVQPQFFSPTMPVSRLAPAWCEKEVSELCHCGSVNVVVERPWREAQQRVCATS